MCVVGITKVTEFIAFSKSWQQLSQVVVTMVIFAIASVLPTSAGGSSLRRSRSRAPRNGSEISKEN